MKIKNHKKVAQTNHKFRQLYVISFFDDSIGSNASTPVIRLPVRYASQLNEIISFLFVFVFNYVSAEMEK